MELHQTSEYSRYIQSIGWKSIQVDSVFVYIKPFPIIGGLAKLQRPDHLPDPIAFKKALAPYNIRSLGVEPSRSTDPKTLHSWIKHIAPIRIQTEPFLATKTIQVDLTQSTKALFSHFTQAKRRAVRRAQSHNVSIDVSDDIDTLIRVKNKSAGSFGWITTIGLKKLWVAFEHKRAVVLARSSDGTIVGGIFLLFVDGCSYYWIAGATRKGKQLFAPTLLAWEAILYSKKQGNKIFDFVGVWDERIDTINTDWKGFTKFKEGFGGEIIYYPLVRDSKKFF